MQTYTYTYFLLFVFRSWPKARHALQAWRGYQVAVRDYVGERGGYLTVSCGVQVQRAWFGGCAIALPWGELGFGGLGSDSAGGIN